MSVQACEGGLIDLIRPAGIGLAGSWGRVLAERDVGQHREFRRNADDVMADHVMPRLPGAATRHPNPGLPKFTI
jgi:hypothetical protein